MPSEVDAVVVGAGTAGANVAWQLAQRGLSVVVVERRAASDGGAQWYNGVPPWQFDAAGVSRPEPPELVVSKRRLHLFGPDGTRACSLDDPVWTVDMAALGERLRHSAREAGVRFVERATGLDVTLRGDRPESLSVAGSFEGSSVRRHSLRASLFVDASGRRGVLRQTSPVLAEWCPPLSAPELCSAGDHQLEITDPVGAADFCQRHGAEPGDGVTVVGCDGGFSTRAIRVSPDLTRASVLVGCLADGHASTAPRMLADVLRDEPWLSGDGHHGVGVIPLRRPYARFTAPGIALVGDAASQVFCGHGSGIGIGLIAGRMLADAVGSASDPGAEATLWAYQAAFMRTYGAVLIAYDGVRRTSTAIGSVGVSAMVRAGLLSPTLAHAGLDQRHGRPALGELPAMLKGMAMDPRLALEVLPRLARAQAAASHAGRYPRSVDELALRRWDRRVSRLLSG